MSHRDPKPRTQPSKISIPQHVGPHVRLVFSEMKRQNITYDDAEYGSGVLRTTIKAWRKRSRPGLESIEAVLGYLGWDFVPLPREETLPQEVRDRLKPVAEELEMSMEQAVGALLAILVGIRTRFEGADCSLPDGNVVRIPPRPRARKRKVPAVAGQTLLFEASADAA
ncbi:hypothetical protein [Amorphus sp. MBR-141]